MQADQALIVEGEARTAAPEDVPAARVVVVVLGIEDSSTLAEVLERLGGDVVPATPSAQDNGPAGSGPDKTNALMALNDEVLAAIGSSWDDILRILPDRLREAELAELQERAIRLLAADSVENHPVLVLADPLLCRLVPFWLDAIEAWGANARFAVVVREPP